MPAYTSAKGATMEKDTASRDALGATGSLLPFQPGTPPHLPSIARMSTRTRVVHTALIFFTFLGFGLCRGIYGPTLLELRTITGVSLTKISMLFTCLGVGGIMGSLTFGRLFDVINPLSLFVVVLTGIALVTSLIPWLHVLSAMMGACALHSFLYSGLSIGCTVTLFRLWRRRSNQILLSMHLLYTIGGFIAPLLSEPFLTHHKTSILTDVNHNTSPPSPYLSNHSTTHIVLGNKSTQINYVGLPDAKSGSPIMKVGDNEGFSLDNLTNVTFMGVGVDLHTAYRYNINSTEDVGLRHSSSAEYYFGFYLLRSRVVFAYLIIGAYLLTVAVAMLSLLLYMRSQETGKYWRAAQSVSVFPCQVSAFRRLATVLFMAYNFNFGGQETVFSALLFTFSVEHVGFTPTRGSLLVSILYTAHAVGRFLVIIVSHWVPSAVRVLVCSVIGCSISCAILTHYTTTNTPALWSATVIMGFSVSTMYTMGLLWAKEFLPITATFTSLYTIAYTTGMMLWPPLTSYFVKTRGAAWFAYINDIMLVNYAITILLLFTLHKCRHRFKCSSPSGDEEGGKKTHARAGVDLVAISMHSLHTI